MHRIRKAEKREYVLILLGFSLLLALGVVLLIVFFNKNIILVLFGLFITFLAIKYIYLRLTVLTNDTLPLTTILLKEPHKVVWVYSMVTQRMPFGFQIIQSGTMYFKLINGDEFTLSLPVSELRSISEMLNYHLPHATFGYTKEREQWYLAHPELLIKNEPLDS